MPTKDQIRLARTQAGLTQQQAADLLGVPRNTWARYEMGIRSLTASEWALWKHRAGLERLPFRKRVLQLDQ